MTPTRLWLVREALAAAGAIAGSATSLVASAGLGLSLIGAAIVLVSANALMRVAIASNEDRYRDERARRFFDGTGHWPDEA